MEVGEEEQLSVVSCQWAVVGRPGVQDCIRPLF